MSLPRILIAEPGEADSLAVGRVLCPPLELDLAQVDTRPRLVEAIADGRWDAIVIDCELPGLDLPGAERLLTQVGPEVPVILVSWGLGESAAVAAMKVGAHDCVLKSDLARLAPALEQALGQAEQRRALRLEIEALRASELRFRSLLTSTHDVVFTLDWEQRVTSVYGRGLGPAAEKPDRIVGRTPREIFGATAGQVHEEATARALAGEPVLYEWTESRTWGFRTFQTSLAPVLDVGGHVTGLVGVSREVTALKLGQPGAVAAQAPPGDPPAPPVPSEVNLNGVIAGLEWIRNTALGLDLGGNSRFDPTDPLRDAAEAIRRIVLELKTRARANLEARGPRPLKTQPDDRIRR